MAFLVALSLLLNSDAIRFANDETVIFAPTDQWIADFGWKQQLADIPDRPETRRNVPMHKGQC